MLIHVEDSLIEELMEVVWGGYSWVRVCDVVVDRCGGVVSGCVLC